MVLGAVGLTRGLLHPSADRIAASYTSTGEQPIPSTESPAGTVETHGIISPRVRGETGARGVRVGQAAGITYGAILDIGTWVAIQPESGNRRASRAEVDIVSGIDQEAVTPGEAIWVERIAGHRAAVATYTKGQTDRILAVSSAVASDAGLSAEHCWIAVVPTADVSREALRRIATDLSLPQGSVPVAVAVGVTVTIGIVSLVAGHVPIEGTRDRQQHRQ